jgi:2-desacetyl-2-hydroxyethyl bacteriochlorophyllide A dehydrogenase
MQAMLLRGTQLSIEDMDKPSPAPGEVLVRVRACGICGSDLHFARYREQNQAAERSARGQPPVAPGASRPIVMGHEFVAEVVEEGPGVDHWTPGTRVVGTPWILDPNADRGRHTIGYSARYPGGYAEYAVMTSELMLPVPDHVSDEVAATVEPCAVGLHATREAHVAPDERVLIMGAGPIGLSVLLWLKSTGVKHVTVTDLAAARRELAARIGADLVLDPVADNVGARLRAAPGAPQVIFECVGVEGTVQQAMDIAGMRSRIIIVGVCMTVDHFRPMVGINKHLTFQFVSAYTPEEVADTLDGISNGAIDPSPLITRTVTLNELPAAFQSLGDPKDCKVVLRFA